MAKVTFLGLGVMGAPMARHLAADGHEVTVYNRTTLKAEAWVAEHGGALGKTPAEAAKDAEYVFACVGNDDDLRSVTTGPGGAFETMSPDAVFIDNTSTSAIVAQELYAAAREKGLHFLDCPVSGGQKGAEDGVLTVMCGGDEAVFERAKPVIDAFSRAVTYMGPAGSGQITKMVNQICIAGLLQSLSEGLHFAQTAGLDAHRVIDVISQGAAGSWQMQNNGPTMVDDTFDHGFAVDWMRKDYLNCLSQAREMGVSLPVTAMVDQYYQDIQNMGGGRWDISSLIKRMKG